ncbi:hypothetical protein M758_9G168900 [Ceratodon purpureus]|nr:hypothetical protein M758_9G168900 [Ceratodon purpureus]
MGLSNFSTQSKLHGAHQVGWHFGQSSSVGVLHLVVDYCVCLKFCSACSNLSWGAAFSFSIAGSILQAMCAGVQRLHSETVFCSMRGFIVYFAGWGDVGGAWMHVKLLTIYAALSIAASL